MAIHHSGTVTVQNASKPTLKQTGSNVAKVNETKMYESLSKKWAEYQKSSSSIDSHKVPSTNGYMSRVGEKLVWYSNPRDPNIARENERLIQRLRGSTKPSGFQTHNGEEHQSIQMEDKAIQTDLFDITAVSYKFCLFIVTNEPQLELIKLCRNGSVESIITRTHIEIFHSFV